MKIISKFKILIVLGMLFSANVFAAQDYNSSRSNSGVSSDKLDAEVAKMISGLHKELAAKFKKGKMRQKGSMRQKGKDADSYKDVSVTLKVKISPSKKNRAQDYNSSRSNNINGAVPNFDGQLRKQMLKMQKVIMKDFRQRNKKGGKSARNMPDSFFDIWIEVSINERPISRKTQH